MSEKSAKQYVLYAAGELLLVVAGILIALQINNWNETRKATRLQDQVLSSIKEELTTNLIEIEAVQEQRQAFLSWLQQMDPDRATSDVLFWNLPEQERMPEWRGAAPVHLSQAMFEAAQTSGTLTSLDVDMLHQLTQTYNRQEQVNRIGELLLQRIFGLEQDVTYAEVVRLLWRVQEEFFGGQYLLMEEYRKTIAAIDAISQP